MKKHFTFDAAMTYWYFVNEFLCRLFLVNIKKEIHYFVKGGKILQRLYCRHKEHTTVVLGAAVGVETTAQKCSGCGKLTDKQIEV